MKILFKISLFFIFFCSGLYFHVFTMNVPVLGVFAVATAEATAPCDASLVTAAKQATSAMDMASFALISQAGSSALQAAGSAKIAYQADAGIKGTLAAVAMKKFVTCSTAIGTCERTCDAAIANTTAEINLCESDGEPGCLAPLQTEMTAYEGFKSSCIAEETVCNQNALQAAVSTIGAASSLLGAKALGKGTGTPKGGDPTLTPPPNPNLTPPPGFVGTYSGGGDGDGTDDFTGNTSPLPEKKTENKGPKTKTGTGKNSQPGRETASHDGLVGGGPLAGGDPEGLSALSQAAPNSLEEATPSDFIEDEEWEDEAEGEEGRGAPRATGAFTGGEGYAGGGVNSRTNPYGSRGRGSKKLALNGKGRKTAKGELKRNVFGKAGPHDNIFERMSKIIQSFCGKGGPKCQ